MLFPSASCRTNPLSSMSQAQFDGNGIISIVGLPATDVENNAHEHAAGPNERKNPKEQLRHQTAIFENGESSRNQERDAQAKMGCVPNH